MIQKTEKEINEFVEEIRKFWLKYPQQRFGQLLFNYTRFGTRAGLGIIRDIFHYQDEDILKDIREGYQGDYL